LPTRVGRDGSSHEGGNLGRFLAVKTHSIALIEEGRDLTPFASISSFVNKLEVYLGVPHNVIGCTDVQKEHSFSTSKLHSNFSVYSHDVPKVFNNDPLRSNKTISLEILGLGLGCFIFGEVSKPFKNSGVLFSDLGFGDIMVNLENDALHPFEWVLNSLSKGESLPSSFCVKGGGLMTVDYGKPNLFAT